MNKNANLESLTPKLNRLLMTAAMSQIQSKEEYNRISLRESAARRRHSSITCTPTLFSETPFLPRYIRFMKDV